MFNLSPTLARLFSETVSVHTASAGTIDSNGRISAPTFSTTSGIRACVQPLNAKDLKRLPEGADVRDMKVLFVPFALHVASPTAGMMPDEVSIGSDRYQVESVEDWISNGNFCRALVRRKNS